MSRDIDKLAEAIKRTASIPQMAQLRFAICTSVDWDNRVMEAKGVSDELPYYGVMLGFGFIDIKPKTGSLCLIGILEGKEAYSFLINADQVEDVELNIEQLNINGGENAGMVRITELVKKLNVIEKDLNAIKNVFKSWTPVPQDGGSSLKTASAGWAGSSITETKQSDIENEKITH